jgi:hypothetical protein
MKLNFASIIFSDFHRFIRNGSYDVDGIKIVKLSNPNLEVVRLVNGKPETILIDQSEIFPEITESDLDGLKNAVINNWQQVAEYHNLGFNQEQSIYNAVQPYIVETYSDVIEEIVKEANLVDPIPMPEINEGEVISKFASALNTSFLLPNGTLFVGTGIPGNKYSIVHNDFIELALTSHRRSQWDQGRSIEQNVSTLTLANATEAWNVTWSIGSTHEEITDITQMYDVELVMYTNKDGSKNNSLVWKLIRDETTVSKYAMTLLTDLGVAVPNVIDSKGDADKRCVQNSTQLGWFRTVLAQPVAGTAAIEGRFVAELRATHKITGKTISVEHITIADWAGNN